MSTNTDVINTNLISILQEVQDKYRYLPEENIREIAQSLNMPLSEVYGVVTFYKSFSLTPRGRHIVTVCLGTACHIRGSPRVLKKICEILEIEPGETTDDQEFSLETVNCLGCCALGPMVVIDDQYHGLINSTKIPALFQSYNLSPKKEKSE